MMERRNLNESRLSVIVRMSAQVFVFPDGIFRGTPGPVAWRKGRVGETDHSVWTCGRRGGAESLFSIKAFP
ncbi:hypothetical protein SKAU_G00253200 [Synaphobranchus kaupii]|uniref:Uncharacterized protein n=1 Tax=Synaphobranchus kaupii TaxID=118154 RepID=A0A9Q1F395_SYNKA|nr:hypothetical protein SKAU_G00253200 [Synaphobranchus kaupii]